MMHRFLMCVFFAALTVAVALNDCLYCRSKLRSAYVLRLCGGEQRIFAAEHPSSQLNFSTDNNFQLPQKSAASEIDDSSTGESHNDSSNYDDAPDLQEEFPNGFDPFRPGSAFLAELLEGPPLLGGELAKMITCDHKNEERLRYVTTKYNFALRWKKGRYEGQEKNGQISIADTTTEILATQEQRRTFVSAEGDDADFEG
jgi:hypothetical protein